MKKRQIPHTYAIKIEIQKNHPDFNIVYVDCEKFTNETITAIKTATMEQFRQRYRKADVLLIDDIQFLAGKESTQEEFFHTFNTLHNDGRQIVIASDRPAKEIKSLEERLRTRFEWGLTADIQPPDFETRVAIIRRKAELLNLHMPDEVSEFIANHLKSNIRQLEGAVKKLKEVTEAEMNRLRIERARAIDAELYKDERTTPLNAKTGEEESCEK